MWALLLGAAVSSLAAAQSTESVSGERLQIFVTPARGMIDVDARGRVTGGLGLGVLERLAATAGMELTVQATTMPRALAEVQLRPDSCAAGVARSAALEPRYHWLGPLVRTSLHLFARSDDARDLASLGSLQGLRLGAVRNTAAAQWVRDQGLVLSEYALPDSGLRMLAADRIDLLVGSEVAFAAQLQSSGPLRVVRSIGQAEYYLACHPDMAADRRQRLGEALLKLRRQGELRVFGIP